MFSRLSKRILIVLFTISWQSAASCRVGCFRFTARIAERYSFRVWGQKRIKLSHYFARYIDLRTMSNNLNEFSGAPYVILLWILILILNSPPNNQFCQPWEDEAVFSFFQTAPYESRCHISQKLKYAYVAFLESHGFTTLTSKSRCNSFRFILVHHHCHLWVVIISFIKIRLYYNRLITFVSNHRKIIEPSS